MNAPRDHHRDLAPLIAQAFERPLTDAEWSDLTGLLKRDPDARRAYMRLMCLHGQLTSRFSHRENVGAPPERAASSGRSHSRPIAPVTWAFSIAAAIVLTAAVVAIYVFATSEDRASDIEDPTPSAPIATLIGATDSVFYNDDFANPGSDYAPGTYAIESGSAEFLLSNRVSVKLNGPTVVSMRSNTTADLASGSATFRCPPGTEGYTVGLPDGSRVVDLGTEFSVSVPDTGAPTVVVSEGRVRIEHGGGAEPRILSAGQSVALTETGYRDRVVHTVDASGRIEGKAPASGHVIATFTPSDLVVGDTVVVDLDVEPVDPQTRHQWFAIVANATGRGWPAPAGGLLRTDRVETADRFDQHQATENGRITDIGAYTDPGVGNGGGRIRLEITLAGGFDTEAEYRLRIDDDRDGEFDHDVTGRFNLGPELTIALATDAGAHTYRTVDPETDPASETPQP